MLGGFGCSFNNKATYNILLQEIEKKKVQINHH